MAPAKGKRKAAPKTAATTRTTRARSKEAAAPPPAIAPSRRSTRATSNEPLVSLEDPNKILRRSRKTPEVQQLPPPPAAPKEATPEPQDAAVTAASTPVIIETKEVEEYEMQNAQSSPTPAAVFKVETEIETEIEIDVEVGGELEVERQSSPFDDLPTTNRASSPLDEASVHSVDHFDGHQTRLLSTINEETATENRIEEARGIIEHQRNLHAPEQIASSPPTATVRTATPTSSVFHLPSEPEKPASGGFLSALASPLRILATPVSRISRLLGRGAQTQPVQKVAPAAAAKAPTTPNFGRQKATTSNDYNAQLSPYLENFLEDNVQQTPSGGRPYRRATAQQPVTPARSSVTGTSDAKSGSGFSVTHLPDGRPIPVAYRSWIGRQRQRQQQDLDVVHKLEAEAANGDRIITEKEQVFIATTQFKQECLEYWRARQPGNRNRMAIAENSSPPKPSPHITAPLHVTTPLAGSKRGADEIIETTETYEPIHLKQSEVETPSKKRRTHTPVGYNAPVPGDPNYRHVNEERGTSAANAPGSSKPSERTRGWSVAVPDGSDDEDMADNEPTPRAVSMPAGNPSNWIGIPDDFYDDSTSDGEDEETESSLAAASSASSSTSFSQAFVPPTPASAASTSTTQPPATTPYAHKYTPHKPSGLRAMEMASSPVPPQSASMALAVPPTEITPPQSPKVSPVFDELLSDYLRRNPPAKPWSLENYPYIECDGLITKVGAAYKEMLCKRNGIILPS